METSERRMAILKLLCRRRHETMTNLANEFGVSERTIRRDIETLSLHEPIYTQSGRYTGGVYVMENYTMDHMYFQEDQIKVLRKLLSFAQEKRRCDLNEEEIHTLKYLINEYTKPSIS